ncbi:MAG: class I SAM-dependent methyltransferase, partial [Candidatus Binatia bacterium]
MQHNQGEIFAGSECDRWYSRNRTALEGLDLDNDFPLRVMELYRLKPRRVLEIGAANGFRLAAIAERYGAETVAVELSAEAVLDGQAKYPDVKFVRAPSHEIPVEGPFDLVIVNGVFCVVDRAQLLRSVAEADRLLGDGGYLLLGDFLPANLVKVRYHHLMEQELYT